MNRVILYFIGEFAFYLATKTMELIFKIPKLFFRRKSHQSGEASCEQVRSSVCSNHIADEQNPNLELPDLICSDGCCVVSEEFHKKLKQ